MTWQQIGYSFAGEFRFRAQLSATGGWKEHVLGCFQAGLGCGNIRRIWRRRFWKNNFYNFGRSQTYSQLIQHFMTSSIFGGFLAVNRNHDPPAINHVKHGFLVRNRKLPSHWKPLYTSQSMRGMFMLCWDTSKHQKRTHLDPLQLLPHRLAGAACNPMFFESSIRLATEAFPQQVHTSSTSSVRISWPKFVVPMFVLMDWRQHFAIQTQPEG